MNRYSLFFVLAFFHLPAIAIFSQSTCNSDPTYTVLDFWVGNWIVFDADEKQVGENKISKILKGCAIREEWTSSTGNKGESLFYHNTNSKTWKQVWVTEFGLFPGGQKEKELVFNDPGKKVIFQGWYYDQNNEKLFDRTILTKTSDQEVFQEIQISSDGGQSWATTFVGIYRRMGG